MKNIELKIKLAEFYDVLRLLRKNGARPMGRLNQIDTYYNSTKGRLKMREINGRKFQLVYYERPNKSGARVSDYDVIEFNKKQAQQIKVALEKAFGEKVIVKKNRNLWVHNHTRIHLDEVDSLGKFLELETVLDGIPITEGRKEYQRVVRMLSLDKYKKIKGSYAELLKNVRASSSNCR